MTTIKLHETLFPLGGFDCDSWGDAKAYGFGMLQVEPI